MRTYKTVTETKTEQIVDRIYCDKCGEEITFSSNPDPYVIKGTIICASFGYGTNKDGVEDFICLCDDCYDKFIDSFKFPPERTVF